MNEDRYTPIDCGVYSGYEVAIMHRQRLKTRWRDTDGTDHIAVLLPVDLRTEPSKEEFLIAVDSEGHRLKLRLDRIVQSAPVAGPVERGLP